MHKRIGHVFADHFRIAGEEGHIERAGQRQAGGQAVEHFCQNHLCRRRVESQFQPGAGNNRAFQLLREAQNIVTDQIAAHAVPVNKNRQTGEALPHLGDEIRDVFQQVFIAGRMPALPARLPVTAQVKTLQGITRLGQRRRHMSIAVDMFAKAVDEHNDSFGALGRPTMRVHFQAVTRFPLPFNAFHFICLPV